MVIVLAGYARVSTTEQDLRRQVDAPEDAGCERIWSEHASGGRRARFLNGTSA